MDKVNLKEILARVLTLELGFRKIDAELVYDKLVDTLVDLLKQNVAVDIRGFGKFYIGKRKPQTVRNRFTQDHPGGVAKISQRKALRFLPSKVIKELLNKDN
jgi:nucleoid DNA-binding protein